MRTKPKKSLGQNFLIDPNIRRKIVASCDLGAGDHVLEIGAGAGEMTALIAPAVARMFAVEIDSRLMHALKERLAGAGNVQIIKQDILTIPISDYAGAHKLKVIGNIPYYISSPILTYIIRNRTYISQAFLTVQREFAARIVAPPGSKAYGSFSCFVQYYAEVEGLFPIKRTCFSPAPRVDSAFISLTMRKHPAVGVADEDRFFALIRRAFQQRRKTLKNSLKGVVSVERLEQFFREAGKPATVRPEELSLDDFAILASLE